MSRDRPVGPVRAIFGDLVPVNRREIPAWMRKPEPGEGGPTIPPETAAALLHATSQRRPANSNDKRPRDARASASSAAEPSAGQGAVSAPSARSIPRPGSQRPPSASPPSDPALEARMQSAALAAEARESWSPPAAQVDPGPPPVAAALDELRAAIVALHQQKTDVLQQAAPQLLQLAKLIAERVLETEAIRDSGLAARLVREGLHTLDHEGQVAVILGPGFAHEAGNLQANLERDGIRCEVQVHEHLSQFACHIRSELGAVDESLESRLDNVLATFLGQEEA